MNVDYTFDTDDVKRIPGLARGWDDDEPFLTPVFFRSEVLIRFFHDQKFKCVFSSDTYGVLGEIGEDWYLAFGINPNRKVVAWLGDIRKVPAAVQKILLADNVESDHDISSDFYRSQIDIAFLGPIKEVEILLLKHKVNVAFEATYGSAVYLDKSVPAVPELQRQCSKYMRLEFGSEDDLKRFVSEWYEVLAEDLNLEGLQEILRSNSLQVRKDLKGLKTFEQVLVGVLSDEDNRIEPLFHLADLRIWADHRESQSKLEGVKISLGLENSVEPRDLYVKLIEEIHGFMLWLQAVLVGRAI